VDGIPRVHIEQAPGRTAPGRSAGGVGHEQAEESASRGNDSDGREFLSTLPAGRAERRLALVVILISAAVFALAAPFAQVPLARIDAFIPAYQSATAINDLITAILLLGQYRIVRSRALLVLAGGYLFTAAIAVVHALTFPGLISASGLLGAGMQTTAWLFMFWHAGFPIAVIAYAFLKTSDGRVGRADGRAWPAVLAAIAAVAIAVCALTLAATAGESLLPAVMQGNKMAGSISYLLFGTIWVLSPLALATLWVRRPHTVLDVWLMVVMLAWSFDVALSSVLNAARFDLGFYAGRLYGLLAASFVLVVLLLETSALYGRTARAFKIERQDRELRLRELQSELIHLARVSEMGLMVSALVHEVNQPLSAIGNYIRAGQRLAERGEPEKSQAAFQNAAEQATRAAQILKRLRGFLTKEQSERKPESLATVFEEVRALALLSARGQGVTIELKPDPKAATEAVIDKVQIQQVLLNLTRNAVEAMATGPRREIVIATGMLGERILEISVADTGPGLAEEVRTRLFQPFLTTKTQGMGVGLSICRSIVEAHGGRMWATDNVGGGTIFHFTLPLGDARLGARGNP
jgi:two-component system, sensor histidine kinase and response regulator